MGQLNLARPRDTTSWPCPLQRQNIWTKPRSALVQEVIYLRKLLERLCYPQSSPTPIFEDNRTCIAWTEGSVGGSDRANLKRIDLRAHFVNYAVKDGILTLQTVSSAENFADLLTKPLPETVFRILRKCLMGS